MSHDLVYLDYAASAPVREEALAAERAYEASSYAGANPNSLHTPGREAAMALDAARHALVRLVGGGFRPADLVFSSGGTESNNLALFGLSRAVRMKEVARKVVCISAIEHESVMACSGELKNLGFDVRILPVTRAGVVDLGAARELIRNDCALVSVMYANNETGALQPIDELASLAHGAGALMHTDAVQAFCRVPLELGQVDALTITAHKLGGPVGIGALLVRGRVRMVPRAYGGGQESGRRSGTQDVRGASAFAAAATAAASTLLENRACVSARAQELIQRLCSESSCVAPTLTDAAPDDVLPGLVSVLCSGFDGNELVLALDQAGFAVSAGSACAASSTKASHVLVAMGLDGREARSALRISFDERVPKSKIDVFADKLLAILR